MQEPDDQAGAAATQWVVPSAAGGSPQGISVEEAERRLRQAARILANGAIRAAMAAREAGNASPRS